ncbi:MAG: translocation/assembly module TamB, partial [Tannerella sp.]|nr:translocation/assembly module TamB [Tannerella sp.]
MNLPFVRRYLTDVAENELSKRLDTQVKIGEVDVNWINRLVLKDVRLDDKNGEPILEAGNITAGFKLLPIFQNKWILTTVRLFGISCHIKKETPDSDTNIQFIIDALSKNTPESDGNIELQIHSIHIRRSNITYDISNKDSTKQHFDPNHIHINNISGKLSLDYFSNDSIGAHIHKLSFDEKSGLNVDRLSANIAIGKDTAYINDFTAILPHSFISIPSAGIGISDVDSLPALLDKSPVTVDISPSKISPEDFAPFLPFLKDFPDIIDFSACISGSINDISLNKIELQYVGAGMSFSGNMSLNGLIDRDDELYMLGQVKNLHVTTEGLQKIINTFNSNIILPKAVTKPDVLEFTGEISGFINHLVTFGNLSSSIGSVHIDMLIGNKPGATMYLKGNIASSELMLNNLFENVTPYGKARFNAEIDIIKPVHQEISGSVKAQVNEFEYNGYNYENIYLSGTYKDNEYKGSVQMNDPNGKIELQGLFRNENEKSVFDLIANIRDFHPDKLHITDKYENPDIALGINANFTGNNPDDFEGYIELENLSFNTSKDSFLLNSLRIETSSDEHPYRSMHILSDIINGEITGVYSLSSLIRDLLYT